MDQLDLGTPAGGDPYATVGMVHGWLVDAIKEDLRKGDGNPGDNEDIRILALGVNMLRQDPVITGSLLRALENAEHLTNRLGMPPSGADVTKFRTADGLVSYGYWAQPMDSQPGATSKFVTILPQMHTLADDKRGFGGSWNLVTNDNGHFKFNGKASYAGKANGLAARQINPNGYAASTLVAGPFTAEVTLKANFNRKVTADKFITGKITNFEGGEHVNPNWKVRIKASGNNSDGFTSMPYWKPNSTSRPDGIVGDFHARFADGVAAGVYAVTHNPD